MNEPDFLQRQSLSPSREKARSPADAMGLPLAKKIKKDEVSLISSDCSFSPGDTSFAASSSERTDEANSSKGERCRPPQPQEGSCLPSKWTQLRLLHPGSPKEERRRRETTDPQIWRSSVSIEHGERQPNIEGVAWSSLRSARIPSTPRASD